MRVSESDVVFYSLFHGGEANWFIACPQQRRAFRLYVERSVLIVLALAHVQIRIRASDKVGILQSQTILRNVPSHLELLLMRFLMD